MEKMIYDSKLIEKDSWGCLRLPDEAKAKLSKEVMRSLDGIAAKVSDEEREVFLDTDFGYVWCFSSQDTFKSSLLSKIYNGNWEPLSSLANHPDAQNIITDLRAAYNNNPVKFLHFEYQNPFYDPCVIGDVVFAREPKKDIGIYLAIEGGDKMAQGLDNVLKKYNVKI